MMSPFCLQSSENGSICGYNQSLQVWRDWLSSSVVMVNHKHTKIQDGRPWQSNEGWSRGEQQPGCWWPGPDSAVQTGSSLQALPSMFRSAVVLSVPQSQVYAPTLLFAAFLMTSMRFLPSDWKRMFLEGKISLPSLNHLTSAVDLLSSQDKITSSFSTAV